MPYTYDNLGQDYLAACAYADALVGGISVPVAAETAARIAADEVLDEKIDDLDEELSGDIAEEHDRVTEIEEDLQADIDTINSYHPEYIPTDHATLAQAVLDIDALEAAIGNESTTRAAADTAINTSISNEVTARTQADSNLADSIAANTAAINTLTTNLSNESTSRQAGDAALDARLDEIDASPVKHTQVADVSSRINAVTGITISSANVYRAGNIRRLVLGLTITNALQNSWMVIGAFNPETIDNVYTSANSQSMNFLNVSGSPKQYLCRLVRSGGAYTIYLYVQNYVIPSDSTVRYFSWEYWNDANQYTGGTNYDNA